MERSPGVVAGWLSVCLVGLAIAAPGQSARGFVVGADRRPLAGASVSVMRYGGAPEVVTTTDARGHYEFDRGDLSIEDGRHVLVISAEDHCSAALEFNVAWYMGWLPPLMLGRGRSLHGRVRDAAGVPLAAVHVAATEARLINGMWGGTWRPMAHAVTDERGIFSLRGVPDRNLRLEFSSDRHRSEVLSPVALGTPLEVGLGDAPRLAGVVVDAAGAPTAARLEVWYEGYERPQVATVGADGRFDLPWRHAVHCRIHAAVGRPLAAFCATGVLAESGPQLRLQLQPLSELPLLRVTATGDGGAPLREFAAVVVWSGHEVPDEYLWHAFGGARRTATDGVVVLPPPAVAEDDQQGVVFLVAPGRAVTRVDVDWRPDDQLGGAMAMTIATAPEQRVEGVVVDGQGRPVAGARVWPCHVVESFWTMGYAKAPDVAAHTDAAGRFVLGGLAPGRWRVRAQGATRHQGDDKLLTVLPDGPVEALRLQVPPAARVGGTCTEHDDDWWIGMLPQQGVPDVAVLGEQWADAMAPIGADGAFAIDDVTAGLVQPVLLVPRPAEIGDWLRMTLTPRRVPPAGRDDLEIDGGVDRPAVVRGRLRFGEKRPPLQRLAVQWASKSPRAIALQSFAFEEWRAIGTVAGDGTFEVLLPPGRSGLRIVDVMTAIPLAEVAEPLDLEGGDRREVELALDVGEIVLELTDVECAADGPAAKLVYRPQTGGASWESYPTAEMGVDLRAKLTTPVLYAPAGEAGFLVTCETLSPQAAVFAPAWAGYWHLDGDEEADETFTVTAGQTVRVRVEVPRRPR